MLTKTTTLIGTGSKFEILRQTCQKRLSGPITPNALLPAAAAYFACVVSTAQRVRVELPGWDLGTKHALEKLER